MSDEARYEGEEMEGGQSHRMEVARTQAKERGCVVVLPKPNELFIDIDSPAGLEQFEKQWIDMRIATGAKLVRKTPSPSGREGRFHIVVELPRPIKDTERVLLQTLLGSDPVREFISWRRIHRNCPWPTVFFEKPDASS